MKFCILYIYISLAHSFLVIFVSGKVFHLSETQFGLLELLYNFHWFLNVDSELFFEIIQSDLFIVLVSRIFSCRYFSHGFFIDTIGSSDTIENGNTFFFSDTDFFFFQLLFHRYG